MKVLGASEETNSSYANAKSYLRECELKARVQLKATNCLPATENTSINNKKLYPFNEEQLSRIRNQKAAFARLVNEQPIPRNMQLGMQSKERAKKENELLPYKLTGTVIFD